MITSDKPVLTIHESANDDTVASLEKAGYELRRSGDANLAKHRGMSEMICPDCNNRSSILVHFQHVEHEITVTENGFEIDNKIMPLLNWMLNSPEAKKNELEWSLRAVTALDWDDEIPTSLPFKVSAFPNTEFETVSQYAEFLIENKDIELGIIDTQCPVCYERNIIPFWEMIEYNHPDTCPGCIYCETDMAISIDIVAEKCWDCQYPWECCDCPFYTSAIIYNLRGTHWRM